MRIDVFHHGADDDRIISLLNKLMSRQEQLLEGQERIMSLLDDLRAELVTINATTNELAQDVDDLLAKVAAGSVTDADLQAAKDLSVKLRSIADKNTP